MEQPSWTFEDPLEDSCDTYRRSRGDFWPAPYQQDRILGERLPHWRLEEVYDWRPNDFPVIASAEDVQRRRQDTQRDSTPCFQQRDGLSGYMSGSGWPPWSGNEDMRKDDEDEGTRVEDYESGYAQTISSSDDGRETPGKEDESGQASKQEDAGDGLGDKHEESLECTCSNKTRHQALDEREARLNALESQLASRARDLEVDRELLEREREDFESRVRAFNEEQFRREANLADSAVYREPFPHSGSQWLGPGARYKQGNDWDMEQMMGGDSFDFDETGEYGGMFETQHLNMRRYRHPYGY